jgi:hypothetical protein
VYAWNSFDINIEFFSLLVFKALGEIDESSSTKKIYERGLRVACIAMVTGLPCERVEEVINQYHLVVDGQYYTMHKDLIRVLDTLGFIAKRKGLYLRTMSLRHP